MNETDIVKALEAAEGAIRSGKGLKGTGFWRAVGVVRSNPDLAATWAERIARIDKAAFENAVRLKVGARAGTLFLAAVAAGSFALLIFAGGIDGDLSRTLLFVACFAGLLLSTHSLAHWLVGRLLGIEFTHYFLGGPPPPRPGAKTDYGSYLRSSPKKRALMHASGAVVTKLLPFAMIPVGQALRVQDWAQTGLVIVGVVQIFTDVLLSTKSSDWMKVKRELRAARKS